MVPVVPIRQWWVATETGRSLGTARIEIQDPSDTAMNTPSPHMHAQARQGLEP